MGDTSAVRLLAPPVLNLSSCPIFRVHFSFTWGYTPFEEKFGTLIEKMTGVRILKCGVSHTGQRHQYHKFIEIVEQISHLPQALFVFYYWNDVANDHIHPHSTVIDGWLVNSVSIDENYRLVRHSDQELAQQVARKLKRHVEKKPATWERRIKKILKRYSLTVNLIMPQRKHARLVPMDIYTFMCHHLNREVYVSMCRDLNEEGSWFSANPIARENKSALLDFRDFAARNHLPLVVVLIPVGPTGDPRKEGGLNTKHYREVRDFLDAKGIRFVDLTFHFHALGLTAGEIYWKRDPHLNPAGNRAVAEVLIEEFPQLFSK